jgi:hypothetical protein
MTGTEVGAASGGPTPAPSPMELRVASALMMGTLAAGLVGFVIGAAELPDEFAAAEAVAIWSVGVVGVLSWLRHYVFYRGDAARMGWTGGFAGFQWEVGYANLAFGLTALAAVFGDWGEGAVAATVVGYALYMLQAGLVHVWQAFTATAREHLGPETVVRKTFSLIFAGVLLYYGARALEAADAWPFSRSPTEATSAPRTWPVCSQSAGRLRPASWPQRPQRRWAAGPSSSVGMDLGVTSAEAGRVVGAPCSG